MNYKKLIYDIINEINDESTLAMIYHDNLSDYHDNFLITKLYDDWYHNQTDIEFELTIFILSLENLFDDMLFYENSITGDYMLRDGKHKKFQKELSIDEQLFRIIVEDTKKYDAYVDISEPKIVINKKHVNNKATILHEMIHAHEYILQKQKTLLKEIVLIELYKNLKPQLAKRSLNLDAIIFNHANIPHNQDLSEYGGEHDLLFLLKSLDLDLKCDFELFTVFGYDYIRAFKEMNLI